MKLNELGKAKSMPNWAGVLVAIGALVSGAGAMWTQVEETFPALFFDDGYYQEYANHFGEEPASTNTMSYPDVGEIEVAFYESDGCFLITAPGREPHWLTRRTLGFDPGTRRFVETILAGFRTGTEIAPPIPVSVTDDECVTDGCQNPHLGEFEVRYGEPRDERGGTWTPVYRSWEDGCEHYQLRRADGVWDVDQEGRPLVCWTRCVH